MEIEIWKDVQGYENKYQVSNKGREYIKEHTILVYTKNAPRKFIGTRELLQILGNEDNE